MYKDAVSVRLKEKMDIKIHLAQASILFKINPETQHEWKYFIAKNYRHTFLTEMKDVPTMIKMKFYNS